MIIELHNEAHELPEKFRIYGTEEEFIRLSDQLKSGSRNEPLVGPGWIEVDPGNKDHIVTAKPQSPVVKPWLRVVKV